MRKKTKGNLNYFLTVEEKKKIKNRGIAINL